MKLRLLIVLLGCCSTATSVFAVSKDYDIRGQFPLTGIYFFAGAGVGYGKLKIDKPKGIGSDSSINETVFFGVGGREGRLFVDLTNYGNFKKNTDSYKVKSNAYGLGMSLTYDVSNKTKFTPYIGGRLALNRYKVEVATSANTDKHSQWSFGYGLTTGVQYDITEGVALDLGADYNVVSPRIKQSGVKLAIVFRSL